MDEGPCLPSIKMDGCCSSVRLRKGKVYEEDVEVEVGYDFLTIFLFCNIDVWI